jgi:redox-sensing transcriptional repressor
MAMVAVPADVAQDVVNQVVAAGVRGILNFAPTSVSVPPHVAMNAVDLSVQLEQLSFQVNVSPLGQTG